jgi:general stress protein CsbA
MDKIAETTRAKFERHRIATVLDMKMISALLSRYGSDNWMDEIRKCSAMPGFICVTKMVNHMKKETDRVTEGTCYEGKGQFYHDAKTMTYSSIGFSLLRDFRQGQDITIPFLAIALS